MGVATVMTGGNVLVGRKYRLVITPEQSAMAEEWTGA
jgi:hypothetical protein